MPEVSNPARYRRNVSQKGQILAGGGTQDRSVDREGQSGLILPPPFHSLLPKAPKPKDRPAKPLQFHKFLLWPGGGSRAPHPLANLFIVSWPSRKEETHRPWG